MTAEGLSEGFEMGEPGAESRSITDFRTGKERVLSPEEARQFERLKTGASKVIEAFGLRRSEDGNKGENLSIITDSGADPLYIEALYQSGREAAGDDCRLVVSKKPTGPAQPFGGDIGERILSSDCVLYVTSFSRSHSDESRTALFPEVSPDLIKSLPKSGIPTTISAQLMAESPETLQRLLADLQKTRQERRGAEFPGRLRMISITNINQDILTEGAAQENLDEMGKRLDRLTDVMKNVESVRITSSVGTDLQLATKSDKAMTENGKIYTPGQAANFPFGEWGCAVDLERTNGTLVVDGVSTLPVGELDQPITLKIERGVVVNIEGGESAQRLKEVLDEANRAWREKNPDDHRTDAYRLAELGIGVNSKAFRYSADGKKIAPPTSLEGEKGLGTIHIAFGKNTIFGVEQSDPDYNPIAVHIDNIIMHTTVSAKKRDGSEQTIIENGEAKF